MLFVGKIFLNLIEMQNNAIPLIFACFEAFQTMGYTRKKIDEFDPDFPFKR